MAKQTALKQQKVVRCLSERLLDLIRYYIVNTRSSIRSDHIINMKHCEITSFWSIYLSLAVYRIR